MEKRNGLAKWTAVLFVVLLVNTAYITAFASPTVFYMTNVLAHLVLGLVLRGDRHFHRALDPVEALAVVQVRDDAAQQQADHQTDRGHRQCLG